MNEYKILLGVRDNRDCISLLSRNQLSLLKFKDNNGGKLYNYYHSKIVDFSLFIYDTEDSILEFVILATKKDVTKKDFIILETFMYNTNNIYNHDLPIMHYFDKKNGFSYGYVVGAVLSLVLWFGGGRKMAGAGT